MKTLAAAIAAVLLAGCGPQTPPQEAITEACGADIAGYTGVATESGVFVEGAGQDATQAERNAAGNSAACTLAGADAPDEVWQRMVAAGREGHGNGADSWDGWDAVWSYSTDTGLDVSLTTR